MTHQPTPSPTVQRLVAYLADASEPHPGIVDLTAWLTASPRFRAFVEANRDKIRKKLRGATSAGARLDVLAELRVAALLLADARIVLAFEAYGAGRRGPDFTVTFRTGRPFNVEVTRRRGPGDAVLEPAVLGKLRQLPPSASNVIVVAVARDGPPDAGSIMRDLRARADHRDDAFFQARGLAGSGAFRAGILRLAAVVVVPAGGEASGRVAHWRNAAARIPLPEPALRALVAALSGNPSTVRAAHGASIPLSTDA